MRTAAFFAAYLIVCVAIPAYGLGLLLTGWLS